MQSRVVIIGGGLAGLSTGRYARANGFHTTVIEHNAVLGGVCQAWVRGPYTIDGCIHWLTGGPFDQLYRELGIFPRVSTHTLTTWVRYEDAYDGFSIALGRDIEALERGLLAAAPEDAEEIARIMDGLKRIAEVPPPIDRPAELGGMRAALGQLWEMRGHLRTFAHFRKPVRIWATEHLKSQRLQRLFTHLVPEETPTLFVLLTLGYLARGWLSRPDGGTAAFRDALVDSYRASGGAELLRSTVDEILVRDGRVSGVLLADGSIIDADVVVSTASTPETTLRLLGGRYGADEIQARLAKWKLFDPIILASYGVSVPLADVAPTLLIDRVAPFDSGGRTEDRLYVRIYNDDASSAPAGHTVVQAMVPTTYDWWARRGERYREAKDAIAAELQGRLEARLPAMKGHVDLIDVATPLTYWTTARSWRGAYEGWMPSSESFSNHTKKTIPGLQGLYLAGQWVEPGGGVPTALMSGRQAVQLLCADMGMSFEPPRVAPTS